MLTNRLLFKLFILFLLGFYNVTSKANTVSWKGGTGNWSTASNWTPAAPVAGDIVIIGDNNALFSTTSAVTVDVSISLASLTFATASTTINLIVNSGITLTTTGNITQQHSSANASVTTSISGAGTINCQGSFLVGDATAPSSLGTLGIVTTNNTNVTNLTTINITLTTINITHNLTLNTTSISGTLSTAILFGTNVSAADVNNPVLNFNSGSISIGGTLDMTNSAYVSVGSFTGSGVPYPATKNYSHFFVNPSTGAGTTLTFTGTTPLNINADGNGAAFLDFNGTGTGTTTIVYAGSSAQTAYASTTGLDNSPSTYHNITFSGTGTKTFATGSMTVSGDWVSSGGKIDLATNGASVTFTKATPTISNTGAGVVFGNVTLSSSSPTLSGTGSFSVGSSGILTLTGTSTLTTGGILTLLSDATGSAGVATIPSGCSVSGNVNVQRYVQGNNNINYRGYRLLSSPVSVLSSGLINIDYIANSTIVTGATTTAGGAVGGNPTIYLYKESLPVNNTSFVSGNFVGVTNTTSTTLSTLSGSTAGTTTLPKGNGYFVYFRGDNIHTTNKTTPPFAFPENVIFIATGALNQGNVSVNDWFGSGLSFTSTQVAAARGFNLIGNPYASSINWDLFGTAITATNVDNTIYIYNPDKKAYASYMKGMSGVAGSNWPTTTANANVIPSGQGFFVHANNTGATLTFTEAAKTSAQQATTTNLMLAAKSNTQLIANPSYFRVQLAQDTLNEEDVLLWFNPNSSANYVTNEDAVYLKGNNSVSLSLASADNVALAIDQLPLPQTSQKVGLNVKVASTGAYQLNLTELKNVPDLYDIWLMDNYMKDSLDIKHNPTYSFTISADTNSSSLKRFTLVIRANALLAYRLLNFTGSKIAGGDQLKWTTENENNYISFSIQRSTDGGKSFNDLAVTGSSGVGNYVYLDGNPAAANWYRLKQTDQFGSVTYSTVIGIQYSDLSNNAIGRKLSVYPNPTADVVNMSVTNNGSAMSGSYDIIITGSSGNIVKNITSSQSSWQGNVSSLTPGIYMMKVIDKINNKVIGTSKFIKM